MSKLPFSEERKWMIGMLERVLTQEHPDDHGYEEGGQPGVCEHCGWISLEGSQVLPCRHTLREHAKGLLESLLSEERKGPDRLRLVDVRVTLRDRPRRRRRWWLPDWWPL